MNTLFLTFLLGMILQLCCNASAQINYDGHEALYYEIFFEHAGERDGEFKLLFLAKDDRGRIVREWIRPDSQFLGFHVTCEQHGGTQTALFHPADAYMSVVQLPLWNHGQLRTTVGTFALAGRGDVTATAYIGDTFTLSGTTATLRNLSPFEATLQLTGAETPLTIPISSTGALRSQHYQLQKEFYSLQLEQWRAADYYELWYLLSGAAIFLFAGYIVVYGFIFIGWLTCDRHLERRKARDRTS